MGKCIAKNNLKMFNVSVMCIFGSIVLAGFASVLADGFTNMFVVCSREFSWKFLLLGNDFFKNVYYSQRSGCVGDRTTSSSTLPERRR